MKIILVPALIFGLLWTLRAKNQAFAEDYSTLKVPLEVSVGIFDPTEAEDFVTVRVLLNLGKGLISLDSKLQPQPSLAEKWTVSKDQKTYTFYLKKTVWSNGQPLTSADFIRGFEHTLSPTTTAKIAVPLLELIQGAADYKTGKTKDFSKVGVKAPDETTIIFTLTHASSYFLALLALPVAFPEPVAAEDFKIKPGTPTSGSYVLESVSPTKVVLAPNKLSIEPAVNRLEFIIISEGSTAMSLYEKNQLDVIFRVPSSDFERFKNSPELVTAPWLSTYYLGFNVTKPPFNDKSLRQAIIEAVDRNQLNKILKDPQHPSSSWIPNPLETSQLSYGPSFDPTLARKTWKKSPSRPNHFELVFDAQEKNNLIAEFVQSQLKSSLGVDISLRSMEWKSYLHYVKQNAPPFFRFAWLAAFPDPLSHLGVFTSNNPNNDTGYASQKYDRLVQEIARTAKNDHRTQLIQEAQEQLLTKDVVIFPLFHYMQYTLIRRTWRGLDLTPMGLLYFHRARKETHPNSSS